MKKQHNKSSLESLVILKENQETNLQWWNLLNKKYRQDVDGLSDTQCWETKAEDGRLSIKSKKVCYAYQLAAVMKYGPSELHKVSSTKSEEGALTISHLCGSENSRCFNPGHIIIEPKKTNDQRTHCHFCCRNALDSSGRVGLETVLETGICNHVPQCCSTDEQATSF